MSPPAAAIEVFCASHWTAIRVRSAGSTLTGISIPIDRAAFIRAVGNTYRS